MKKYARSIFFGSLVLMYAAFALAIFFSGTGLQNTMIITGLVSMVAAIITGVTNISRL